MKDCELAQLETRAEELRYWLRQPAVQAAIDLQEQMSHALAVIMRRITTINSSHLHTE